MAKTYRERVKVVHDEGEDFDYSLEACADIASEADAELAACRARIAELEVDASTLLKIIGRARQKLATYVYVFEGDTELRKLLAEWDAALNSKKESIT